MATTQEARAKALHEDLMDMLGGMHKADRPTVITLASLHSGEGGQWIIGDDKQDKALCAERLRLAADILDPVPTARLPGGQPKGQQK